MVRVGHLEYASQVALVVGMKAFDILNSSVFGKAVMGLYVAFFFLGQSCL